MSINALISTIILVANDGDRGREEGKLDHTVTTAGWSNTTPASDVAARSTPTEPDISSPLTDA